MLFKNIVVLSMMFLIYSCASKSELKEDYALINFYIGQVTKNGNTIQIGDSIAEGDIIITDEKSSCDIKIGGSMLRIKEKSKLTFAQAMRENGMENTTLEFESGKILCKPKKLLKDENFMIKTRTTVAAVRGTQFSVASDSNNTTQIKVFAGEVKVAKRIKAVEGSMEKILENSAPVTQKNSVIITQAQVDEASLKIDKAIAQSGSIDSAILTVQDEAGIAKNDIKEFKPEDFKEEKEIIDITPKEEKETAVIKKEIIKESGPIGRLLITKGNIYFIKDGKIEWSGKVLGEPVNLDNMIFVASGDKIFGANKSGPVIWQTSISNDGKIDVKNNSIYVYIDGKAMKINMKNGSILK